MFNAKVYTVDSRNPKAEAFAVKGDRFIAVGSTSDMRALAGKNTQMYDAKQMAIVPGFIDCHNHAPGTTLLYEVLVGNPYEVEFVTIASIVEKLRARAKETPPGTWVDGYFFDDTKVKDKRELDASDLDEVSLDHPVVVRHRGGHTSYYNHKALEMAGITKITVLGWPGSWACPTMPWRGSARPLMKGSGPGVGTRSRRLSRYTADPTSSR